MVCVLLYRDEEEVVSVNDGEISCSGDWALCGEVNCETLWWGLWMRFLMKVGFFRIEVHMWSWIG